MSKLGRVIQRRRQNRRPSPIKPAAYQPLHGRMDSEIPINELLSVGTDTALDELTEIDERLKQASLERSYTYASAAERVMRMDLSSYRGHDKGSRGLKSEMRYAE